MRCIFVLDVFNGAVVHAFRGERSRYEPIELYSQILSTSEPLAVLAEIRPREVYVADLNRLMGSGDNLDVIMAISHLAKTMADIGVSNQKDLDYLPREISLILGTETASLRLMEEASQKRKIIASLDLKGRKVLTRDPWLAKQDPFRVLGKLNDIPLESVVLLELDRVGTSVGLDREFLKKAVSVSQHPLILGGGVRGIEDLDVLDGLGFSGALVATAVHNGRIPVQMLR